MTAPGKVGLSAIPRGDPAFFFMVNFIVLVKASVESRSAFTGLNLVVGVVSAAL